MHAREKKGGWEFEYTVFGNHFQVRYIIDYYYVPVREYDTRALALHSYSHWYSFSFSLVILIVATHTHTARS